LIITNIKIIKKVKWTNSLYVTKISAQEKIGWQRRFSIERNSLSSRSTYQIGLNHFQRFLSQKYPSYIIETILEPLAEDKINPYELLDGFVSYLQTLNLTPSSIKLYIASIKSYFAYYDIDIIHSKFKRKVKMPRPYREDEEPLDVNGIRKILLNCNNRRLKAYLLLLASGGMCAKEALAVRLCDVDFSVNPTKIHIRKEFAKTSTYQMKLPTFSNNGLIGNIVIKARIHPQKVVLTTT
jgi:integrase